MMGCDVIGEVAAPDSVTTGAGGAPAFLLLFEAQPVASTIIDVKINSVFINKFPLTFGCL